MQKQITFSHTVDRKASSFPHKTKHIALKELLQWSFQW